ncbi:MAG: THUMP domain-containing protein [archaeon]|mgnify:CR=1 FL=1
MDKFSTNCVIALSAPEIAIKSDEVRSFMERMLRDNMTEFLKRHEVHYDSIERASGRMFISTQQPESTINALSKCFGINVLCPAIKIDFDATLEDLESNVIPLCENKFKTTFAVRVKSYAGKITSKQVEIALGSAILKKWPKLKVKLNDPEKQLNLVLYSDKAYVYFDSVKGSEGMPVGCQGRVHLICDGFEEKKDSLRLGWMLMKSGCRVSVSGANLKELGEWASKGEIMECSLDEAKQLFADGRIMGFFCPATDDEGSKKAAVLIGQKVISPLIFCETVTPFD